jgi:glycosyltransferase involved in cell wall biosynthesis
MIYHNITPYYFFEKKSPLYTLCKKGIEYLSALSKKVEGAIGDSNLNSKALLEQNFKNVETIPLLIDTQKIIDAKWDYELFDKKADDFNIIFIGRVAKNKAQHDLIKIANIYRKISDHFKLYIIGGITELSYKNELQDLISKYNLEENVILTGKVSDKDLFAYYRSANIFLSMSKHEGFGIPLIESMLFNIPVIAYNSSNIKDTLNGGGILFNKKSYEYIASTIHIIRTNRALRRAILETQTKAIKAYNHNEIVDKLVLYLKKMNIECNMPSITTKKDKIIYQFEGPFDSSYSLAILNRYSALSFEKKYPNQVSIFATEGAGDYNPNQEFLEKNSKI